MATPPVKKLPQKSSDDFKKVDELDAAESRARAAMGLANEQAARADALQAQVAFEREQHRAELLQRQLDAALASAAKSPVVEAAPRSIPPSNAAVVHVLGKKIVVSFSVLTLVGSIGATVYSNYTSLRDKLEAHDKYISGAAAVKEAQDKRIVDLTKEVASLRETVADQAGFLRGSLPKAGLQVTAEKGATQMDVVSDPLPPGTKPRKMVNVITPIPAPKPRGQ